MEGLDLIAIALFAAGFVSYAGMKLAAGRRSEAHWLVYAIAALFVARYLLLS